MIVCYIYTWSPCCIVQTHIRWYMFLCFNRAKENNGRTINEAGSLHAAIVLRACSFVLLCNRAVCVCSPYSMNSRGGSPLLIFLNNCVGMWTSWSFHCWQPAPRWTLHWWLTKPDNPAMSLHSPKKMGTLHTDTQWKAEGGDGWKLKPLNTPHIMLLLPALINKRYHAKQVECHACASIPKPLTMIGHSRS